MPAEVEFSLSYLKLSYYFHKIQLMAVDSANSHFGIIKLSCYEVLRLDFFENIVFSDFC
jgi:hypothetical protein